MKPPIKIYQPFNINKGQNGAQLFSLFIKNLSMIETMSFLYELPKTLIYKMPITIGHNYYFLFKRHNM